MPFVIQGFFCNFCCLLENFFRGACLSMDCEIRLINLLKTLLKLLSVREVKFEKYE